MHGGSITYDGDSVVEERLAEDDDVEQLVDVDGLEDGEHGDGVDGGEQRREDERVQQRQTDRVAEHARLTESPQRQTDQKRVRLHAPGQQQQHGYTARLPTARNSRVVVVSTGRKVVVV